MAMCGIRSCLSACWLIVASVWLVACGQAEPLRLQGAAQGTSWHVVVVQPQQPVQQASLQAGIEQILANVDAQMSTWRDDSELSRFNQSSSTDWFPVSADLAQVVEVAAQVSALSGGVYDVTVGPLVHLWGFGAKTLEQRVPTDAEVQAVRAAVGYQKLQVQTNPPALRKAQPGMVVDLASIAPGYSVDLLARYLESIGVHDYMVELGGEVFAKGKSPRGDDWRIAIEKPLEGERTIQQGMRLAGQGLSTSGDYRDFFEAGGKRYSHTLDPATGYPVSHRLASVSVVAANTTLADAYSTLLMAMGEVKGREFADAHQLSAYFIWRTDKGFDTYATAGFKPLLLEKE